MSEWEKAKEKWGRQEIKLGYLMDRELIQAADKDIATRDAELARLREALEKIEKPEMPVNALVLMKIAQEALKSQ